MSREVVVSVEDLALRGGPLYGYRLIARRQAEDFTLTVSSPFVNIPAAATAVIGVSADRRGYDGPIQLTIPDLPNGIHVNGGVIPREYIDGANTRSINRRGILTITADPGVVWATSQLEVWGEGLAGGTVLRRRARGLGMVVDVAGATDQGAVDRQRPLTAPWLGWDLPAALTDAPAATLEVRQTSFKQLAEGARYEFAYNWTIRGTGTPPKQGQRGHRRCQRHPRDRHDNRRFCRDHHQGNRPRPLRCVCQRPCPHGRRRGSSGCQRDSIRSNRRCRP